MKDSVNLDNSEDDKQYHKYVFDGNRYVLVLESTMKPEIAQIHGIERIDRWHGK